MRDFNASYSRLVAFELATAGKGIPVPHTGYQRRYKHTNGSGVSASSRVLSHYYADEGEKGRMIRKLVRGRERQMWRNEWLAEQFETDAYGYELDDYDVTEWFESVPLHWDYYEDAYSYECEFCKGPCTL